MPLPRFPTRISLIPNRIKKLYVNIEENTPGKYKTEVPADNVTYSLDIHPCKLQ